MLHSALLNVMVKAARRAGRTLNRDLGEVANLQVSLKGPANFVTAADKRAEELLYDELTKARPGYGFIGEEGGTREGTDKANVWIVDPLDGTTNFLHGIPHFAVSIALQREGELIAGLVYNPATDDLFLAEKGKGAYLNDQRMRVAARKTLNESVIACGLPHIGRGDFDVAGAELTGNPAAGRRSAPLRRSRARSRLGRGRSRRRLLGAQPVVMGHGRGHRAGARGRRLRQRHRRAATRFSRRAISLPATTTSIANW